MSTLFHDPHWPRAGAWLRGDHADPTRGRLAVLGAPVARGSITPGRCDLAPAAIRAALDRFSTYDLENGCDLRHLEARDLGDLDIAAATAAEAYEPVRDAVGLATAECTALVLLGGDNSITRPGCRAIENCGLLTLDAHLDMRDLDGGLTNGNPVRALLADGMPGSHIVQIGLQPFANSRAYAELAVAAGIMLISADEVRRRGIDEVIQTALAGLPTESVYIDLDLDVMDRAFAPATPGSRPGGLMPWEIRRAARLCGAHPKVRVMDLVEMDPTRDIADQTALAAAACLLSFASGVLSRC